MKTRILLIVFFIISTELIFAETYISLNGPITTSKSSSNKMARSPNYIRWQNPNISWALNENGCCAKENISIQDLENAVQNGFYNWDTISTANVNFNYNGITENSYGNDGQNTIYWAEENDPAFDNGGPLAELGSGILAVTIITINEYEDIIDADIVFNGKDHSWKVDNSDPDIWAVTSHEVGHLLGLFHSDNINVPVSDLPTMTYYYTSLYSRDVTFDDRVGVSFLYGGNLIADKILLGNIYLKLNLNILPGVTLTILPGSSIKMFNGASIRVKGKLDAIATETKKISFFKYRKNDIWRGIFFTKGSTGQLKFCSINDVNAYGGGALTINNSSPQIQNCVIENNTGYCYGICILNHAAPNIFGDTVRNNSAHAIYIYNASPCLVKNYISGSFNEGIAGVYCDYHAMPIFGMTSPPTKGNNVITSSYYGIYATNSSIACAGQIDFANHNKIYGNSYANAFAKNNSIIYAINNWWGVKLEKIFKDEGSYIYDCPNLTNPHKINYQDYKALDMDYIVDTLTIQQQIIYENQNIGELIKSTFVSGQNEEESKIACLKLGKIYKTKSEDNIIIHLTNLINNSNTPKNLKAIAYEVLAECSFEKKNYNEILNLGSILSSEFKNTIHEKNGLMIQFFYYYNTSQFSSAKKIVDKISSGFHSDEETLIVAWLLNTEGINTNQAYTLDESIKSNDYTNTNNNDNENMLDEFILYQNYPNPFNRNKHKN